MNEPIDLTAIYEEMIRPEPRGDELDIHASDLMSCDYATWLRINGHPEMEFDAETRAKFTTGHAIEQFVADRFNPKGWGVTWNVKVQHEGITGHIDFLLERGDDRIVIDTMTTAGPCEAKMPHVLKSAFYAKAVGAERFVEWVFAIGWGGVIKAQNPFWFETADFEEKLEASIRRLNRIRKTKPPMAPHTELGYLKCGRPGTGKSYCQANCPRNEALKDPQAAPDGSKGSKSPQPLYARPTRR